MIVSSMSPSIIISWMGVGVFTYKVTLFTPVQKVCSLLMSIGRSNLSHKPNNSTNPSKYLSDRSITPLCFRMFSPSRLVQYLLGEFPELVNIVPDSMEVVSVPDTNHFNIEQTEVVIE